MDNTEEKRLCKKCGKRLPSSNNFCMYCGCNNNISDEELAALQSTTDKNLHSQSKQELLNKSIAAKDRPLNVEKGASNSPAKKRPPEERGNLPLTSKLIYVFMLLVIIVMSTILSFNTKNMFFDKFDYNPESYDKFVNINNKTFVGLKNNKIELIGDKSEFSAKEAEKIDKIDKQKVLDIDIFHGTADDKVYVKTNKGLYNITDYGSVNVERIEEPKETLLEDINVELNNNTTLDGKYYDIIDEDGYFIKDGSLYKNVLVERYHYEKGKGVYNIYTSEKVIDESELGITNPRIIDYITRNDSVVILGDDIIKAYTKGTLVSSIDRFTIGNNEYEISDFKYIFYHDGKVSLVDKSDHLFNKDIGEFLKIRTYTSYGYYDRSANTVKPAQEQDLNQNIKIYRNGTHNSLYYQVFPLKKNYKAILIVLGIVILLVGAMYFCKEKPFLISMGVFSGVCFVLVLIFFAYSLSQSKIDIKIDEAIKQIFSYVPEVLFCGYILTLVKEIVAYITEKLNVETIYHFVLIALALITSMLALVMVNELTFMGAAAIGIMWTYICFNDEDYVSNNTDLIKLIPILGILIGSLVFGVILSNMLGVANNYLYIIVIAFCFAYYLALNDSITISNSIFKMFKANSVIIFSLITVVVSWVFSLISLFGKDSDYFTKLVTETVWALTKSVFCLVAALLVIGTIAGILLFLISKLGILLNKINNRTLKVFIYFAIMIVFVSFIMYFIPQIEALLNYIIRIILKINSTDPMKLASSTFGL